MVCWSFLVRTSLATLAFSKGVLAPHLPGSLPRGSPEVGMLIASVLLLGHHSNVRSRWGAGRLYQHAFALLADKPPGLHFLTPSLCLYRCIGWKTTFDFVTLRVMQARSNCHSGLCTRFGWSDFWKGTLTVPHPIHKVGSAKRWRNC